MPKPLFILRPTGLFCRFRVPTDLRVQIGSQFLVRALNTVDKDRARLLAAILGIALGEMFGCLRQGMNVDVKKILAGLDPATLKKWEAKEITVGGVTLKDIHVTDDADQARLNDFVKLLASTTPAPLPTPVAAPIPVKVDKGGFLKDRIEQFLAEQTAGELSLKNISDFNFSLHYLLIGLCGNKPLNEIDGDDADAVMKALLKWPANAAKKRNLKGLMPLEVIAKNEELKFPVIQPRTVEKNLDRLRRFFNWADERSYLTIKNSFSGRRIMTKDKRATRKKVPFDNDDLKSLFHLDLREELCMTESHKFWIPLLALFSGARVNEMAQVYIDDVYQIGEVWVYYIHAKRPDMRIKNPPSERVIPLHKTLLELGFLEYVSDVKALGFKRLFPTLPYSQLNGYGDSVSDWFGRSYLRPSKSTAGNKLAKPRANIADRLKTFHSFRYTFINKVYGLTEDKISVAEFSGHNRGTDAMTAVYLTESEALKRQMTIDKLHYPGLTFTPYQAKQFNGLFLRFMREQKTKKR
jgi:integrase